MPIRGWTQEQREERSRMMKGRTFSPESIAKMRAAKLGKKLSDATKEKLRAVNIGRRHSEEARRKISLAKTGKKYGPNKLRKNLGDAETLRRMFVSERMFIGEIAALHGVSKGTVVARLREFGIRLDSRAGRQTGERGSFYKGGIKISRGYKFVTVPLDSPLRRDRDGYVAEHRLVASEMIGRVIGRDEEVHHLNFEKMDNRPENLAIFGTSADHTRFHKYLERAGAYLLGLAGKPDACALEKPAFLNGQWVTVVELGGP
jgi:hypothetical protein